MNLELTQQGHVHRFQVSHARRGWDVREEHDSTVLYHAHRNNWSHVEAEMQLFDARARSLELDGWTRAATPRIPNPIHDVPEIRQ
jgi:hypothetical protein